MCKHRGQEKKKQGNGYSKEELSDLTSRAKGRDEEALNELFGFLRGYAEGIIYSRGFTLDLYAHVDGDDLAQESCCTVLKSLDSFKARNGATWRV